MPQHADRVQPGLLALAGDFSSPQESAEPIAAFDCQSCGACCSYSAEWPRFSTEDDAQLDRIPAKHVSADESGMRCDGVRCSALTGEVGKHTACGIYEIRPDVCRACLPGHDDCLMARKAHGLTTELPISPTRGEIALPPLPSPIAKTAIACTGEEREESPNRHSLCAALLLDTFPAGRALEEPS